MRLCCLRSCNVTPNDDSVARGRRSTIPRYFLQANSASELNSPDHAGFHVTPRTSLIVLLTLAQNAVLSCDQHFTDI